MLKQIQKSPDICRTYFYGCEGETTWCFSLSLWWLPETWQSLTYRDIISFSVPIFTSPSGYVSVCPFLVTSKDSLIRWRAHCNPIWSYLNPWLITFIRLLFSNNFSLRVKVDESWADIVQPTILPKGGDTFYGKKKCIKYLNSMEFTSFHVPHHSRTSGLIEW